MSKIHDDYEQECIKAQERFMSQEAHDERQAILRKFNAVFGDGSDQMTPVANDEPGFMTTGLFNGGYEIDYLAVTGQRLYAHLYDDGRLVLSISRDGIGMSIQLPPGYTSVLRDYLVHVIPFAEPDEDDQGAEIQRLAARVIADGPPIDPTP